MLAERSGHIDSMSARVLSASSSFLTKEAMNTPTKRLFIACVLCILFACGPYLRFAGWVPNSDAFAKNASRFDIRAYGAKVDGQALGDGYGAWSAMQSDCSMSAGNAVLSCASSHFASTDVGKVIAVYGAGPTEKGYVQPLSTTIAGYTSGTSVTLAATAYNFVNNSERVVWGHDDTIRIQTAIAAACEAGGGIVYIPAGRSLTTGVTVPCSNVGIRGEGRHVSALENWNVATTTTVVYFSPSSRVDQSLVGAYLGHLELRQIKYVQGGNAFGLNQTFKALAEDLRVIGYSYECGVDGGGAHNYGDELRNSEFGPCGNGGPSYGSTTAGINYNGAHIWVHNNKVSMSGQGVEYGGRGGHFEDNELDGSSPAGGVSGAYCFNLGSTGSGVFGVWFGPGNKCHNFSTAVHGGNSIGTMDRVHIEGNSFTDSGRISISGGLDTNSVTCGTVNAHCENDTVIHGVSTIKNNTIISNTVSGGLTVDNSTGLSQGASLESVDIENNLYEYNYVPSGGISVYGIKGGTSGWKPSTTYRAGSNGYAYPTVLNGYVYHASIAGTTGATEPVWPTTIGNTVTDGGVTWTCAYLQPHVSLKNEALSAPPGYADNSALNNAAAITMDGVSREMLSVSNVSANYAWQIYLRTNTTGRSNVGGVETIPADTPYSDSDRYFNTLPIHLNAACCSTYFTRGARIWKSTPTSDGIGQVVTKAGWNAPIWTATTAYGIASYIQAPTDNGHFYRNNLGACTSGSSVPTFPIIIGATVTESSGGKLCTWKESGPDAQFAPLLKKKPPR